MSLTIWGWSDAYDVEGINFTACGFYNWQDNLSYDPNSNKGILSIDAGYMVHGYCDITPPIISPCPTQNLIRSVFQGFNMGIHALSSGTFNTISVDNCDFNANVKGIEINGLNNYSVTRSNFVIGESTKTNLPLYQLGLVSNSASGYRIEENVFTQSVVPATQTIGLQILNSGPNYNESYKNSFNDLTISQNAAGVNRNPFNSFEGFQFLCNEHINSLQNDIAVTLNNTMPNDDGVRSYQGDPSAFISAGNLFSQIGSNPESDFLNNTFWPTIYFHSGGLSEPLSISSNVLPSLTSTINNCVSRFNNNGNRFPLDPGFIDELNSRYFSARNEYLNILYTYHQLIDGGNTSQVLNEIMTSWPQDAWELRNYLMSYSPYLSLDAINEAVRSLILPNAMILEICLANPEGSRNDELIYFLQFEKPDPLSQNMIDMIINNWESESPRSIIESSLANYHSIYNIASDLLIADLKLSDEINTSSIVNYLIGNNSIADNFHLADIYLGMNDFENLEICLTNIANFNLSENEIHDFNLYSDYVSMRSNLNYSNSNLAELNSSEINSLESISSENSIKLSVYAQNILCFFYNNCREYSDLTLTSGSRLRSNNKSSNNSNLNMLTISPNPSGEFALAKINCSEIPKDAKVHIREVTGNILLSKSINSLKYSIVLNTSQLKNGIYIVELINDSRIVESSKLIVSH